MCGILGFVSSLDINKDSFNNLLKRLTHRGPDDYGIYYENNVALGHTRLSILDLSELGHQPMKSVDENYIIIYNGEIYGFETLKDDLVKKGYIFKSHSDTEVILNGYIEYKEKIVNKIDGMFAFAIFNKLTKEIFLARDRSGIKPLYYFKDNDEFSFSSEIKTLKSFSNGVNFESKILFLLLGSVPEPMTIYEDIFVFPAGYYGIYLNNKLTMEKYDEYNYEPKIQKPYSEIVNDVSSLLHQSIKKQLISDAPIGTFLSGGLDSSAITAIAAQYKDNLQTLSLVFEEKELSEEYYQDLVVAKYKTNHTKYLITEKIFLESIDEFIGSFDQPSVDGLNTFLVSKAARDSGLTTVLSGVGGDEIFYGYPSFKNAKKLNFLSKFPYALIKLLQENTKYKKLELLQLPNDFSSYLPTRGMFTPTEVSKILNIEVDVIYKLIIKLFEKYNSSSINMIDDKISFFELNMYMKNQLLRDTDIFGMANSLEIRVPFLDKDLVDYVLKVKPKDKYHKNINKIILADAVKDILPNEIIDRPKMGFTLPFEYWFRKNISQFNLDKSIENKFLNKELHWSRVWALHILNKFDMDFND